MTKTLFAVFFAAAVLSGCAVCTDCEPEYQSASSPTTIYRYTTYPGRQPYVRSGMQQPLPPAPVLDFNYLPRPTAYSPPAQPRVPVYHSAPSAGFSWANRPASNGFYPAYSSSYGSSYYGGGYIGPAFQTPPMSPVPSPAEQYYPFKRPAPGIFVPWNRMYYPASSYYTAPPPSFYQTQAPLPSSQTVPQLMWRSYQ